MDNLSPQIEKQGLIEASRQVVRWLKFVVVFLIAVQIFITCFGIIDSYDFPWQFTEGNYILDHGHVAKSVLNAFGDISPNFQNEYIVYELVLAKINRIAGWNGLMVFFGCLAFCIYIPCLWAFFKSRGRYNIGDVCLFMFAQFLVNMRLTARPELIADNCFFLVGMMLMSWPIQLWGGLQCAGLVVVFCFWANAHGSFLLGLIMMGMWYGQAFLFDWKALLFSGNFRWMRPGVAALVGCALNPFGIYRLVQPFQLHSLLWGQATSLEMWPVDSIGSLLPLLWSGFAIFVIAVRAHRRRCYWILAMLVLLQYLTYCSVRYSIFIGLSMLLVVWDELRRPQKKLNPSDLPMSIYLIRLAIYAFVVLGLISLIKMVIRQKTKMFEDYVHYIYPKGQLPMASSIIWMREHPSHEYFLLSTLSAGSCSQMLGVTGIHPLIDSGTHRFSDRANQFHYYTLFSPKALDLALSELDVNAVAVNRVNASWAVVLNGNSKWRLAQINADSQLYLPRNHESVDEDRKLFLDWEKEDRIHPVDPDAPPGFTTMNIMRGLGLRSDVDSLNMLLDSSDFSWISDPQVVFLQSWLAEVPKNLIVEALRILDDNLDNRSAALRLLFLQRLGEYAQAADLAEKWHPNFLGVGYADMQMLRVDALISGGRMSEAKSLLRSLWPQSRYSLRWAQLCQKVYADNPNAMPAAARLLVGLTDNSAWETEEIVSLNQNIRRISEQSTGKPK